MWRFRAEGDVGIYTLLAVITNDFGKLTLNCEEKKMSVRASFDMKIIFFPMRYLKFEQHRW
jgi:hypothetical protein